VASVILSVIVSSRVSDPRTAEQVSMVIIVPVLALFLGQLSGFFVLDFRSILVSAAALLAVDAGLVWLGVRLFQREVILTRWR
jgi:ABC-2 type transport system permease protein